MRDIEAWLDRNNRPGCIWVVKRLSGNDTLQNRSHQAGPYLPKHLLFRIFPKLRDKAGKNPRVRIALQIESHADAGRAVNAIWYNNALRGGTRDETRMTGFGGRKSALLDPENTGAIAAFVFRVSAGGDALCAVWVARDEREEESIEDLLGEIEPGRILYWSPGAGDFAADVEQQGGDKDYWLSPEEIPAEWMRQFPSGQEIVDFAVARRPYKKLDIDNRLLRRRECEYLMFRSLEHAIEFPRISKGFKDIESFVGCANTILQRRKSRGGRSLELQTRVLLVEEGLTEGADFTMQPKAGSEGMPDFIFPNVNAYADRSFPASRLRALAVKTTFKDRWRQITREARRVLNKHLLTLQQGVSVSQFSEIREANITLVVPKALHESYPEEVRPHILTVSQFVREIHETVASS